jgi:hypothetical protein
MNVPTRDELLDELAEELVGAPVPSNAITVRMLVDKTGLSEKTCREKLDALVKSGKWCVNKQQIPYWYYPIE